MKFPKGLAVFAIFLAVCVVFLLKPTCILFEKTDCSVVKHDLVGFRNAIRAYINEYSSIPTGNAAQVVSQLMSNNLRRIAFLEVPSTSINSAGEFCDPWDTPYQIAISWTNMAVRSAGPDKRFDTKDDIAAP